MLAGILRRWPRTAALISPAPLTALMVVALNFATPAVGADLDYSSGRQPPPPYDYGAPPYPPQPYPPQRFLPPPEAPHNRHSSIDQPPPYHERTPVYPSQRHLPSREGPYGERYTYQQPPYDYGYPRRRYGIYDQPPYGHYPYDQGEPPYRSYRPSPNADDQAYRGNGDGGDYPAGAMPPRPRAPIDGPPRGWIADPRDFPENGVAEAVPPYEAWPAYPPGRWR
jgi:hypothetical protein